MWHRIGQIVRHARNRIVNRQVAIASMLLIHVGLLAYGAYRHSPTIDEAAHLPAGIDHWNRARFELYIVNPPLVRMVAAIPMCWSNPATDLEQYNSLPAQRSEFQIAEDFVFANGTRVFWLMTLARWACIPFTLVGAWVVYRWSGELFGPNAALAALACWCFSPNILTHAQLITPDVAAASFGALCYWRLWKWTDKPTWRNTGWFGLALGLAELTKFTWVILLPLAVLGWFARCGFRRAFRTPRPSASENAASAEARGGQPGFGAKLLRFFVALLLAHQLILLGYAYDRVFLPLGEFKFVSGTLKGDANAAPRGGEAQAADSTVSPREGNRFRGTWLEKIPVPLPQCLVQGIDVQKLDFERNTRLSYLRGVLRYPGWWYYYLYALVVKVPLGAWLLGVLALLAALGRRGARLPWRDHIYFALPVIAILALVSWQTGINRHFRYVLPIFPFVIVWISQAFAVKASRPWIHRAACAALGWAIASSLWVYPHSMSYFNEAVGGPSNGHWHLIDSNIDWGQDLIELREWADEHPWIIDNPWAEEESPERPVGFVFYSSYFPFPPSLCGFPYRIPPPGPKSLLADNRSFDPDKQAGPQPGWYIISVNYLHYPYPMPQDGDKDEEYDLSYFSEFEPVDRIGYSLHVYYISPDEARDVRRRIWGIDSPTR